MERLQISNPRFGPLEVDPDALIHFDGLPGFPGARRFSLVRHDRSPHFGWLVCADDPELAFVVANPWDFFPDYRVEVRAGDLQRIRASAEELTGLEVLVIACLRSEEATLNLAAPILVNPRNRQAAQVILETGDSPIRAPITNPADAKPTGDPGE